MCLTAWRIPNVSASYKPVGQLGFEPRPCPLIRKVALTVVRLACQGGVSRTLDHLSPSEGGWPLPDTLINWEACRARTDLTGFTVRGLSLFGLSLHAVRLGGLGPPTPSFED